jgi:hypothetical protein
MERIFILRLICDQTVKPFFLLYLVEAQRWDGSDIY